MIPDLAKCVVESLNVRLILSSPKWNLLSNQIAQYASKKVVAANEMKHLWLLSQFKTCLSQVIENLAIAVDVARLPIRRDGAAAFVKRVSQK